MGRWISITVAIALTFLGASCSGAKEVYPFEGQIDLLKREGLITIKLGEDSSLHLKVSELEKDSYQVSLNIVHWQTRFFNLSSEIESSLKIKDSPSVGQPPVLSGQVWSRYSLWDYKPIQEISGWFEWHGSTLSLMDLSLGNVVLQGSVDFMAPFTTDLDVHLNSVSLNDFLHFWISDQEYDCEGTVSGEVKLSGDRNRLALKGSLESIGGTIENFSYDSMFILMSGVYPKVAIERSHFSNTDGMSYQFEGPLDLNDSATFREQIKALHFSPMVSTSQEQSAWTLKRIQNAGSGRTELKYLFRDDKSRDSLEKHPVDMLGIERIFEF
jgi:hypothetical protein